PNAIINQPEICDDRTANHDDASCEARNTSSRLDVPNHTVMHRSPDKLPDPWLFDSEKLLRELDRCREMVLLIQAPTHETHFAVNNAVDAIWNLTQQLRFLLHLHREGQRAFAKQHSSNAIPSISPCYAQGSS